MSNSKFIKRSVKYIYDFIISLSILYLKIRDIFNFKDSKVCLSLKLNVLTDALSETETGRGELPNAAVCTATPPKK